MIKMTLKCTRCKAGWIASGMPGQFYLDALKEFLDNHSVCVDKVAANTAEPDAHAFNKPSAPEA
jgi:hypothetical protein